MPMLPEQQAFCLILDSHLMNTDFFLLRVCSLSVIGFWLDCSSWYGAEKVTMLGLEKIPIATNKICCYGEREMWKSSLLLNKKSWYLEN